MKSMKIAAISLAMVAVLPFAGCTKNDKLTIGSTDNYASIPYNYNLDEYVTLGNYKGLIYDSSAIEVTDAEVTSEINTEILNNNLATSNTSATSVVADGQTVNIDFTGYIDGKTFDGGSATGSNLTIGSGKFIAGFEDGLIGSHPGDTVSLNLKFPDNYTKADLKGKAVVFKVTINYICEIPEMTPDIVSTLSNAVLGEKYTDLKEYKTRIMYEMANSKKKTVTYNLLKQAVNASTILKYPNKEYEDYYDGMIDYYTTYATQSNLSLEDYVSQKYGWDMDTFHEQCKTNSQSQIAIQMVSIAIARKEGINFTDDEFNIAVDNLVTTGSYQSTDALYEENGEAKVVTWLFTDKIRDYLFDNATKL